MTFQIDIRAGLGFLVAVGWAVVSVSASPSPVTPTERFYRISPPWLSQSRSLVFVSDSALVRIGSFL
jgi:hypothetical protein